MISSTRPASISFDTSERATLNLNELPLIRSFVTHLHFIQWPTQFYVGATVAGRPGLS